VMLSENDCSDILSKVRTSSVAKWFRIGDCRVFEPHSELYCITWRENFSRGGL